jgi:hypothetical protein
MIDISLLIWQQTSSKLIGAWKPKNFIFLNKLTKDIWLTGKW